MKTVSTKIGRVYLIKLLADSTKYFAKSDQIIDVLKFSEYGIEWIKEFNESKLNFKRVSKKDLSNQINWNTELMQHPQMKAFLK